MRAGAQSLLGTRGGSKRDQLPATAGPPLSVGGGKDRRLPRTGKAVPRSHWSLDRLRPPGGARGPRRKRAESCRAAQIGPRFPLGQLPLAKAIPGWPAGPSLLSLSSPPSRVCSSRAGRRTPVSRHSPLTLLAAAFWRLPFGGDVPQPTSGERRPADHPRPGARTGQATPPLYGVLTQRLRPVVSPARSPEWAWPSVRIPKPLGCWLGEGGVLCNQLGEAPVSHQ